MTEHLYGDETAGPFWAEPGQDYAEQAKDELGFEDDDMESVELADGRLPTGYPNWDAVYARAWELREADEDE